MLCETNPALRAGLQAALFGKGLRELLICRDVVDLTAVLHETFVDLVICDVNLPGLDFCDMAQRIRRKTVGRNPFTLLIATLNDASVSEVRRMVNAGADRVLRKPVPMNVMLDNIDALLRQRRPFVATDNYVGPTRRALPRPEDSRDELLTVPNTMRARVFDKTDTGRLLLLVEESWRKLEQLKSVTSSASIIRLIGRVLAHYDGAMDIRSLRTDLNRLVAVSRSLMRRNRGRADHVAGLASSLISVTAQIAQAPLSPQKTHLRLLAQLGEVIKRITSARHDSVDVIQQIALTVEQYSGPPPEENLS